MEERNPYNKYKTQSIMSSSPPELTLMLYNGCIRFVGRAIKAIENRDIEGANDSIIRAELIIEEFMNTLDMKYEISKRLILLYDYIYRRLVDANLSKDKEILEEVLGHVTGLRDNWEIAMASLKRKVENL